MAELLLTAAAGSAASAGAAGGAALALVPGVGAAASAGLSSTVLSILSGVATAFGVLGTVSGAASEQNSLEMQAMETELQSGQEHLQSVNRQTQMRRELMKVLGDNRVAAASSGIDLTGGIAAQQEQTQKQQAARDTSIERSDDDYRRALMKARAAGLRSRGRDAMTGGLLRGAGQFAQFGADLMNRG